VLIQVIIVVKAQCYAVEKHAKKDKVIIISKIDDKMKAYRDEAIILQNNLNLEF
jgi:hypothetical protein